MPSPCSLVRLFAGSLGSSRPFFLVVVVLVDAVANFCGVSNRAHISDLTITTKLQPGNIPALPPRRPLIPRPVRDVAFFFTCLVSRKESYLSTSPHAQLRPSHCALRNMPAPICRMGKKMEVLRHCWGSRQSVSSDHTSKGCFERSPDHSAISTSQIREVGTSSREHVGSHCANAMLEPWHSWHTPVKRDVDLLQNTTHPRPQSSR